MSIQGRINTPVAIIGMACRLPGADNLDQFWNLLRGGRTALGPAPADRFDRGLLYDPRKGVFGKSYTDLAGVVSYGPIDRDLYPIPDATLASSDIAHVTLCQVVMDACRHARFNPMALPHRNTGVYVGHTRASGLAGDMTYGTYIAQTAEYLREVGDFDRLGGGVGNAIISDLIAQIRRENPRRQPNGGPFLSANYAASIISQTLGLNGPCMAFNAACASSLQALVQGVQALQLGHVDMAVVGGASYFHSDTLVMFSQAQSVTTKRSCPFDEEADGLVVAEGYAAVLLKTLDRAAADGNQIYAVIPSWGISSDGHGKSLWAPRKEGQVKAIRRAYNSQVPINRLQYIEAHATSTHLGDATEIAALAEVLGPELPPETKIPIGSVKSNIGHTLETAGLAGLIKAVLAIQNAVVPPTANCLELNKQVDWQRVPVFVPTKEMQWPAPGDGYPRRAAVNAFGIGGLNAHIVLDEYVPSKSIMVAIGGLPSQIAQPAPISRSDETVAIIGMGSIFPGAKTIEAFWELLASARDARTDVPAERWNAAAFYRPGASEPWHTSAKLGGFINDFVYDWRMHKIPPKQIAQASPLQFMILDAVEQALGCTKYDKRSMDRSGIGVVVGTGFAGDFSAQLAMSLQLPLFQRTLAQVLRKYGAAEDCIQTIAKGYTEVFLKHMPAMLDETGSFTSSSLASRITKTFDLMGGGVAVDAGAASSMAALDCCVDQLLSGACDMMICVGGQQDMGPTSYESWSLSGLLAAGRTASPFDAQADGIVPGEGCGALLLKRLSDARRDGDKIFGVIRGVGAAYESSRGQAVRSAIDRALQASDAKPDEVVLVETSGTGRAGLDAQELQGINDAFGNTSRSQPAFMSTVIGHIGHLGGAAGMASIIKAVLELEHMEAPATAGFKTPAAFLSRYASNLQLTSHLSGIHVSNPSQRAIAGVNSCCGNELAYHALIERGIKAKMISQTPIRTSEQARALPGSGDSASRIVHFDATIRRREKMRHKAAARTATTPSITASAESHTSTSSVTGRIAGAGSLSSPPLTGRPTIKNQPAAPMRHSQSSSIEAITESGENGSLRYSSPAPVQSAAVASSSSVALATVSRPVASPAPIELETFLVNFVVEQTGYPPEIVELDADLEADLGIDSIKKAQLFGELREYFDITPSENLTLDDFPTLRHVLNFLRASTAEADPQGVVTVVPTPVRSTADAQSVTAPAPNELEAFLVNFVVEQTGYPPEIVELDADLEADLGIDSIKKAQLFGELREYFDITPSENLTLDDFPTLRHVLYYLLESLDATAENGAANDSAGLFIPKLKPK
jgi:acyl transferase domain-containing protein/acyl carrier protein